MIKVYDINNNSFRDINAQKARNGFVLFQRFALSVIEKYYCICGYFFLNKEKSIIAPIDIQEEILSIPEEAFLDMNCSCKDELEKYNLVTNVIYKISYPFSYLFILDKEDDSYNWFENTCKYIMNNPRYLYKLHYFNKSIVYPVTSEELYIFAKNLYKLIEFDYVSPKYESNFKYVVDALINGYHINFCKCEIKQYAEYVSQIAFEKLVKNDE